MQEAIPYKTMTKLNGKSLITKSALPFVFVAIGAFSRILPHPANFAPIAAMALFGGTYMKKSQAFTLPLLAMILSDLIIGFDSLPMRIAVYSCFMFSVLLGFWIREHKDYKHAAIASLISSVVFFTVTNFAVWAFGTMYAKTSVGLAECYVLAIPFFRNTILGDLFYSGMFFGGYELAQRVFHRLSLQS